jgi:probable DNA metabolism protein
MHSAVHRYLYDGSAEGLLSAISVILAAESDYEKVILAERENTLFEEGLFIGTDPESADQLFSRLRQHAPDAASTLYYLMLAEASGMETSLLHYIALAFRHGDRVNGHLTHPAVKEIVSMARKSGRELHRMKGLLRFQQLHDGTWLARMEPDFNVIQPLAHHFSRRLRAQEWFIYDVKRRSAAHWNRSTLQFGTLEQFTSPVLTEEEKQVQSMWQTFFRTIAIPDRKNPRLQKSNMPMKYWKYLTEK